jgi:hypothetical protein
MRSSFYRAVLVWLGWLVGGADAIAAQPLSVEVTAKSTPAGPALTFVVRNVSTNPVTLEEWRLPWGQRQSVVVVAAEPKSGAPLKEVTLIDDVFSSPKVTIKPGDSLSGDIDLTHYVADIDKKSRTTDLLVFWYYNSHGAGGSLGEYGGWLTLEKSHR